MVEIFADVAPDSELFEQYSSISPKICRIPGARVEYNQGRMAGISDPTRRVARADVSPGQSRHRLGIIDDAMSARIVAARRRSARRYSGRDDICEFFQPDRFSAALSIQDNILFGRVAFDQANAQARITAMVRASQRGGVERRTRAARPRVRRRNSGSRLLVPGAPAACHRPRPHEDLRHAGVQRADVGARSPQRKCACWNGAAWAKRPNGALVTVEGRARARVDRVLVFAEGQLVEEGKFEELERGGNALSQLVAEPAECRFSIAFPDAIGQN